MQTADTVLINLRKTRSTMSCVVVLWPLMILNYTALKYLYLAVPWRNDEIILKIMKWNGWKSCRSRTARSKEVEIKMSHQFLAVARLLFAKMVSMGYSFLLFKGLGKGRWFIKGFKILVFRLDDYHKLRL